MLKMVMKWTSVIAIVEQSDRINERAHLKAINYEGVSQTN